MHYGYDLKCDLNSSICRADRFLSTESVLFVYWHFCRHAFAVPVGPPSDFHLLQYANIVRHSLNTNSFLALTLSKNQSINRQNRSALKVV